MDIFYFFSAGGAEGGVRSARGAGRRYFIENPRGVVSRRTRRRGREGVCANRGIFWGGGLNIFFRGRNVHQALARIGKNKRSWGNVNGGLANGGVGPKSTNQAKKGSFRGSS